ncbi:MAG: TIGR03618 family F420-dependent PPOX class oxidoreductase [Chloroflexota bacterium]|nr:TIGR03618 family F420-dependent PPOX class oxidoreductase [Chloroflexota bacterium]
MRRGLRPEDLGDLLERPLLATLATRRIGDSILLSPVWHEWRDGAFIITVEADDGKLRHVERDPRVTIVVAESEPPYRGLEIRGTAEVLPLGYGTTIRRIGRRYIGPAADRMWSEDDDTGVVLRIAPGDLRAWDFADDYPAP